MSDTLTELDKLKEERRVALEWIDDARSASIIALIISVGVLLFSFWALALYNGEVKDFSPISFSLALLQTILAIGAFAGFWLIRGVAVNKAKEVAEVEAKKAANKAVKSHLAKNLEGDINSAITALLNGEDGPKLLGKAISDPNIIALIAAEISKSGLLTAPSAGSGSNPPAAPITNPGKSSSKPKQNLNELHSEFWFGIAEADKKRFLKPYEEPPFEE